MLKDFAAQGGCGLSQCIYYAFVLRGIEVFKRIDRITNSLSKDEWPGQQPGAYETGEV
jgi:hypothetical protein